MSNKNRMSAWMQSKFKKKGFKLKFTKKNQNRRIKIRNQKHARRQQKILANIKRQPWGRWKLSSNPKKMSEQREPRNINLNFMSDRWWKIPFPTRWEGGITMDINEKDKPTLWMNFLCDVLSFCKDGPFPLSFSYPCYGSDGKLWRWQK